MRRRKFLIGMGSVATATSAVLGTGAVESARLEDRTARVQISQSDTSSSTAMYYIRDANNGDEVDITTDAKGRAILQFKDMDGNTGGGIGTGSVDLNHSGVFNFHTVFKLRNQGADTNDFWITLEDMPNGTNGGDGDNWIYFNPVSDFTPNVANKPGNKSSSNNKISIPSGSTRAFGVHLDTRDNSLNPGNTIDLEMTVHADEP